MQRRGPDGQGWWQEDGVVIGHRRLAILDLDDRAAQPMVSACGRYVIAFNGEIYNFRALRLELESKGTRFRTDSDTEVLLALFAAEGEAMLPQLHGMFAFVIWDREIRRGFAARDPYGIKPLYIASTGDGLLLGSQVQGLVATGLVSREPCPDGQAGFWMLGSVPEPYTWYRDVRALPAGHAMWIEDGRTRGVRSWQDIGGVWRNADAAPATSCHEVQAAVRSAVRESVQRHLVSDVPVGVFLSGGIDSGALAGLVADEVPGAIEGVTIAFEEFAGTADDEAPLAAAIADHYGIRHSVRKVTRREFIDDLPRLLEAMDQPSVDGINTWYASKAIAERGLKVALSGVGGDELFQGYSHFRSTPAVLRARRMLGLVPAGAALLGGVGAAQAKRTGKARWKHLSEWTRTVEGVWWLRRSIHTPDELPALMGGDLAHEAMARMDVVERVRSMTGPLPKDPVLAIGQIESMTYLRNQLLRDSDWASMDHSIELRTPLVDAHLLSSLQAWLPSFAQFPGKSLLARAPAKPLPESVLRRQKTGFGIPVGRWLKGSAIAESSPDWQTWVSTRAGGAT